MRTRAFVLLLAAGSLLPAAAPVAFWHSGGGYSSHRSTPGTGSGAGARTDGTHAGSGSGSRYRGDVDPWDDDYWQDSVGWRIKRWLRR